MALEEVHIRLSRRSAHPREVVKHRARGAIRKRDRGRSFYRLKETQAEGGRSRSFLRTGIILSRGSRTDAFVVELLRAGTRRESDRNTRVSIAGTKSPRVRGRFDGCDRRSTRGSRIEGLCQMNWTLLRGFFFFLLCDSSFWGISKCFIRYLQIIYNKVYYALHPDRNN